MKLNVAQELKQPGRIGKCHEDVILDRQEYLGRELKFAAPLTVEGEYFFDGEGFSFKGTATTRLDSECALCGKPFIEELTFDFDERFLREPEPDSECYGYTGEELDVSQMLLDDLFPVSWNVRSAMSPSWLIVYAKSAAITTASRQLQWIRTNIA